MGMPSGAKEGGGEGLSLQTLVIAAAASAAAAVIVSHVWKNGTVVAAAMTPVIVAIVKELLARPMESEIVRKPVSKIASGSRAAIGGAATGARSGSATGRARLDEPVPPARVSPPGRVSPPARTEPRDPHPVTNGSGPDHGELTPMKTYGRSRR